MSEPDDLQLLRAIRQGDAAAFQGLYRRHRCAAGTVTETYYPAGARGNEKEMVGTSETWHASDLAGVVYNRIVSPSTGEIVMHPENVKLGDVPDALFGVPSDYPIRDIRFDSAASIE